MAADPYSRSLLSVHQATGDRARPQPELAPDPPAPPRAPTTDGETHSSAADEHREETKFNWLVAVAGLIGVAVVYDMTRK